MPSTAEYPPNLATILGIQLQQHLDDLQRALPARYGYLQSVGDKVTPKQAAADVSGVAPDKGIMLDRETVQTGSGPTSGTATKLYAPKGKAETYIPPANGDKVVEPKGKRRGRTIYLQNTVPVLDERGVAVNAIGQGPFLAPTPEEGIAPIPLAAPVVAGTEPLTPHGFGYLRALYDQIDQAQKAKYGTFL